MTEKHCQKSSRESKLNKFRFGCDTNERSHIGQIYFFFLKPDSVIKLITIIISSFNEEFMNVLQIENNLHILCLLQSLRVNTKQNKVCPYA